MCQGLDWFLSLFHPSLLCVCLHQTSTRCADTYPGTHLSKYSWADLFRIGVSGREKAGRKFKQSWCWDFIVSRDVYELSLTRIWLQQVRYWRAGRERKEVLSFPVSSKGGNKQENSMKQLLLKRRLEERNWDSEEYHQKRKVSHELNSWKECCIPELLYQWLWFSSSCQSLPTTHCLNC